MGFFNSAPKKVTPQEFKEIMSNLYGKLEKEERVEVEKLFRSDLSEAGIEAGISQAEFDAAILWLEQNKKKHVLEDGDIEHIKKYFNQHLKD